MLTRSRVYRVRQRAREGDDGDSTNKSWRNHRAVFELAFENTAYNFILWIHLVLLLFLFSTSALTLSSQIYFLYWEIPGSYLYWEEGDSTEREGQIGLWVNNVKASVLSLSIYKPTTITSSPSSL